MAKKNRWEHLNDFKKDENGRYEYQGKSYVFAGSGDEQKKAYIKLWSYLILSSASVIISGCISGAGLTNSFYVIIPFLAEAVCLFTLIWNHFKLFTKKSEIRTYIYNSAHPKITPSAMLLAFFAVAGFITSVIHSVTTGFEDGAVKAAIYLALKLSCTCAALFYRKVFLTLEWVEI